MDHKLTVDVTDIAQEDFVGFGVQWSAYPHADADRAEWGHLMTDGKWQELYRRLDAMRPSIVRVIDQANWRYLRGFGPDGEVLVDYNSQEVRSLEKILSYCQDRGITVLLGEWGCPYKMHDVEVGNGDRFTGAQDEAWLREIVAFLTYLIREKGYSCIKYYNLINEPNGSWASTNGDWVEWSEGVRTLSGLIHQAGLGEHLRIAGPDAVAHFDHPGSAYTGRGWLEASVEQLDDVIGLYDIHSYASVPSVRSGEFSQYYAELPGKVRARNKAIIFGELGFDRNSVENQERVKADPCASEDSQMSVYDFSYGLDMANALMQLTAMGYSGAIAWSLDDAMHTNGDLGEKDQLKRWGMWNILGTELCNDPKDEEIRPWYFAWSLLCNAFPQGSKILAEPVFSNKGGDHLTEASTTLRAIAAVHDEDYSVSVINTSAQDRIIEVNKPQDKKMYAYQYREEDFPGVSELQDLLQTTSPAGRKVIRVKVPASGFVLITSKELVSELSAQIPAPQ